MRARGYLAVATLAAIAAAAACTLNPQPLPPGDEERNAGDEAPSAGFGGTDAGMSSETQNPPPDSDAGNGLDGSADGAADGGDAGSDDGGSDAGSDADAG